MNESPMPREPRETSQVVHVLNELGLHARPAAVLAQEARKFRADVTLAMNGQVVDAKSILEVLSLAASRGTALLLRAEGPDAAQALESLVQCFQRRFGEDK